MMLGDLWLAWLAWLGLLLLLAGVQKTYAGLTCVVIVGVRPWFWCGVLLLIYMAASCAAR